MGNEVCYCKPCRTHGQVVAASGDAEVSQIFDDASPFAMQVSSESDGVVHMAKFISTSTLSNASDAGLPPPFSKEKAPERQSLQKRRSLSLPNISTGFRSTASGVMIEKMKVLECTKQGRPISPGKTDKDPDSKTSIEQNQSSKIRQKRRMSDAMINHLAAPLPGAFADRPTLFFFDWDDTLCPTLWIREKLGWNLAELNKWDDKRMYDYEYSIPRWFQIALPDDPRFNNYMSRLQDAALRAIKVAQKFGVVVIVTNSIPGWVERTVKRWFPKFQPYLLGHGSVPSIPVFHAQEYYREHQISKGKHLPFIGRREILWKRDAMVHAMRSAHTLYRLQDVDGLSSRFSSWLPNFKLFRDVFSIGDSDIDMKAVDFAMSTLQAEHHGMEAPASGGPTQPYTKKVKLLDCPHVTELAVQLDTLADLLPELVPSREHSRVECRTGCDIASLPKSKVFRHCKKRQEPWNMDLSLSPRSA